MSIIGKNVRWKYKKEDGTPVVDMYGTVVACDMASSTSFSLLIQGKNGQFFTANPADMEEAGSYDGCADCTPCDSPTLRYDRELEEAIRAMNLWEDNGTDACQQAVVLLNDFMAELKEHADALTAKDVEIAKLKAKKPKKADEPKETP